jgi:hypothetical protein
MEHNNADTTTQAQWAAAHVGLLSRSSRFGRRLVGDGHVAKCLASLQSVAVRRATKKHYNFELLAKEHTFLAGWASCANTSRATRSIYLRSSVLLCFPKQKARTPRFYCAIGEFIDSRFSSARGRISTHSRPLVFRRQKKTRHPHAPVRLRCAALPRRRARSQ